jgi:dTMP kinase
MARGRLIVFEGVEGAGKSTQLGRLAELFVRAGVTHRSFREPGGTPLGDEIRRVLLDPASQISARAEALLFMASRAQLVACELLPSLAAGAVVLLDRFFLSTYAYQIAGRRLPDADVRATNLMATGGLVPDLTLLFTLPSGQGLARAARRGERDRIEQADEVFHALVERAFTEFATPEWQRVHEECGPIVAVDATGSPGEVEARALDAMMARFAELRAALGAAA